MRALVVVTAAAAVAVIPAAGHAAPWAQASAVKPTITRVSPMRVRVGDTITVRGRHFSSHPTRDKVVFKAKNGRLAIGRVVRASSGKLVLRVPSAAEYVLTRKGTARAATRMYLRVVTNHHYGTRSKLRHSPVVVSSGA